MPTATGPTESTLPDGRPVSVVAVFGNDLITLTGSVPTQAAADELVAFADDFRLTPATVVNNLVVDPDVPVAGGIRIVELDSVHFVDDSDVITSGQARQLDRIVMLMTASPNLTLHVVGNTELSDEPTRNYVISQRRAESVVEYLVSHGIARSRLTTEPAGESNPLSLLATAEANSINSRTDFVFYGIVDG